MRRKAQYESYCELYMIEPGSILREIIDNIEDEVIRWYLADVVSHNPLIGMIVEIRTKGGKAQRIRMRYDMDRGEYVGWAIECLDPQIKFISDGPRRVAASYIPSYII